VAPTHPVDNLTDQQLHDLLFRVDTTGFPGDLEHLWRVERQRYRETLRRIPPARHDHETLLDLGSSRPWLPFFQVVLGYRHIVLNTAYPDAHFVDDGLTVRGEPPADVRVSVFDIECDRFPFPEESFDVVLCLEVLEHLALDPMAMMAEVNRVLRTGGTFVLTTPNAVGHGNALKILLGESPGWTPYNGYDTNRHNREYSPHEIGQLYRAAGIAPDEVTTFGSKCRGFQRDLLRRLMAVLLRTFPRCPSRWRRDVILAAGRKTSTVADRRPSWLYFDMAERSTAINGPRHTSHPNPVAASSATSGVTPSV
jgi:SAM-dependent methyltransferase